MNHRRASVYDSGREIYYVKPSERFTGGLTYDTTIEDLNIIISR